ncbi:MAG TPA: LLM class flavin-dependent oxidoreductase [Dehalococcoidia bacterium]|nr:LLM class flavin-dependent oxidoreductase [Dehalococcoidia bacterium]
MRLGVNLGDARHLTADDWLYFARLAEELGYSSFWVGEPPGGWDAFALLGMIAKATTRIRLGTGIVNIYARSPLSTAQAAATVDRLSGGRMSLGLGVTSANAAENGYGGTWSAPNRRLREYIEVLRLALTGSRLDYNGQFYRLKRFRLAILPEQERLPIYVAAMAKRNVSLAGELADGWLPVFLTPEAIARQLQWLQEGATKVGRDLHSFSISPLVKTWVAEGGILEFARMRAKKEMAHYVGSAVGGVGAFYYDLVAKFYGFSDEATRIRNAFHADPSRAYEQVDETIVDTLYAFGNLESCTERLRKYVQVGATEPILIFVVDMSIEQMESTLRKVAKALL